MEESELEPVTHRFNFRGPLIGRVHGNHQAGGPYLTATGLPKMLNGDLIYIEGFSIHGMDRLNIVYLDHEPNEEGISHLLISPGIILSGQYKNCDAPPADGAAIYRGRLYPEVVYLP